MDGSQESEKQILCKHQNFSSLVRIARMEDTGRFMADVTIECADCQLPFHFKGLPAGCIGDGAAVSPDALEGRFAIGPGRAGILHYQE